KWAAGIGLRVSYGSLFNVPAVSSAFDVVLSVSVLEHVPHKELALKEALRLLKPGGKLFLSFDIAIEPQAIEDHLRVEILTSKRLHNMFTAVGLKAPVCSDAQTRQSADLIQADNVAGIPAGMTVGSVVVSN